MNKNKVEDILDECTLDDKINLTNSLNQLETKIDALFKRIGDLEEKLDGRN